VRCNPEESLLPARCGHRAAQKMGRAATHRNNRRNVMSVTRETAQGATKQLIGQMIGDGLLVQEGKEQQKRAKDQNEAHSHAAHASKKPANERRER
jgi:uncharacterized protein YjbJ (UPF0337 family)